MQPLAISSRRRHNFYSTKHLFVFMRRLSGPPSTEASKTELMQTAAASAHSAFGGREDDSEREGLVGVPSSTSKTQLPESLDPSNCINSQRDLRNTRWPRFGPQQRQPREEYSFFRASAGPSRGHDRVWQHASDSPTYSQERFTIASYNILAHTYAFQHKRTLYARVPGYILDWKSRKRKIMFELGLCSSDVICLQEVDRFKDLEEELALKGYVGLYKARTGGMPDGCAIFWRKDRFKLLHDESLEFCDLGMRHNVAQLCVLESVVAETSNNENSSGSGMHGQGHRHYLVVGNIHVLYNPKRGDIKLGQCRTFLEQLHKLSDSWHRAPVVIGGDFNSTPSSAVYEFLATSELELSGLDRNYLSGQISRLASPASTDLTENAATKVLSEKTIEILENSLGSYELSQKKSHMSEGADKEQVTLGSGSSYTGLPEMESSDTTAGEVQAEACIVIGEALQHKKIEISHSDIVFNPTETGIMDSLEPVVPVVPSLENCSPLDSVQGAISDGSLETCSNTAIPNDRKCQQLAGTRIETDAMKDPTANFDVKSSIGRRLEEKDGDLKEAKDDNCNIVNDYHWDIEELKIATGSPDCTVVQHKLNLCSVYSEIQGRRGTRDIKGEPLVTTYHENFKGTVDYIWHSDGLKPVKVLDTIPIEALVMNNVLPVKVWGSDHLAIACELAFIPQQTELVNNKPDT